MKRILGGLIVVLASVCIIAARGESLAAFDERCIPAGGVAPPSNTPGILGRRALPAGRLTRLGATPDFHHGLLTLERVELHADGGEFLGEYSDVVAKGLEEDLGMPAILGKPLAELSTQLG